MGDATRLKLDKRIHNQRLRLRQMEGFHWGADHLRTIKRYCMLLESYRKAVADRKALEAENARLLAIIAEAVEWDGHDEEGVPAVWYDEARAALGEQQ